MTSSTPNPAPDDPARIPIPDPGEPRPAAEPTTPDGEHARTPLLAALGAGNAAVAAVARTFSDALSATATTRENVQQRVHDLPAELEALRGRFSADELRRAFATYRVHVEQAYAEFADRGEDAWGRLREKPQVRQAMTRLESYSEKLDARVDGLVDDAQGVASRALAVAGRQSRAAGERVAQAGERFTGRAADAVVDASAATSSAVEDAGTGTAGAIEDAGDEAAAAARATGDRAARATGTAARPSRGPKGSTGS
jgi:heparin binding hemagglutinin HbhA